MAWSVCILHGILSQHLHIASQPRGVDGCEVVVKSCQCQDNVAECFLMPNTTLATWINTWDAHGMVVI